MSILSYAGSATSMAFGVASSVFRPDASSSRSSTQTAVKKSSHSRNGSSLPHYTPLGDITNRSNSSSLSNPHASSPHSHHQQQHYAKSQCNAAKADEIREAEQMCMRINETDDLYDILGVHRKAKLDEIRRAFLSRSRLCHPDKLPHYPDSTPAFQRLSYAYETLSKPNSRRLYDLSGGRGWDTSAAREAHAAAMNDETLNGVLRNVFNEFLAGDFEMIRVFINAMNEGNPGLNLGDEAVDNLEGVFRRVREVVLSGQKYLRIIRFELIRLYEIQHNLRSLSYFDIVGRLRLTLALTRVTLEIPMVLDRAMREEPVSAPAHDPSNNKENTSKAGSSRGSPSSSSELQRRGLLPTRVKGALVLACYVLEKGEKFGI